MKSVVVSKHSLIRVLRETAVAADLAASAHVDGGRYQLYAILYCVVFERFLYHTIFSARPRHSNAQERLLQIQRIGQRFSL
jgi:hypothetical protein